MDTWDNRFLGTAEHIAFWSKHPVEQVGAVIADYNHNLVSQGFNGLPSGADDSKIAVRHTLHAELNAVLRALAGGQHLANCTIYCTHPPCSRCCAVIAQVGFISRVVAIQGGDGFNSRWRADCQEGRELLAECGITYEESFRI